MSVVRSGMQPQVDAPGWMRWAGLAAIAGGLLAVVLTVPFASAYYPAYAIEGESPPRWLKSLEPELGSLLTFAAPVRVYELYGKIFNVVYLLILPAVFSLHRLHQEGSSPKEMWAFRVLVGGLIATSIGVAGDYWANGIGFPIEVLGLLATIVGTTLYGVATLRSGVLPRWSSWLLVAGGPGAFAGMAVTGHLPSGPTLLFAVSWLAVGILLSRDALIAVRAPLRDTQ